VAFDCHKTSSTLVNTIAIEHDFRTLFGSSADRGSLSGRSVASDGMVDSVVVVVPDAAVDGLDMGAVDARSDVLGPDAVLDWLRERRLC
jgi:hypothetical protein